MNSSKSVSLDSLKGGTVGRVVALRGGRQFQHRIASMGLAVGGEVEVIHNGGRSGSSEPMVVRVGDTRLMLGCGMAQKIFVRSE